MHPVTFQVIEEAALLRHGSAAIARRLPKPKNTAELAVIPDDRWLSTMTRRVFQAGLKHELVDNKWPAFEEVFQGFVPERVAGLYDEDLEAMLADKRLIRHMGKLQATRHNAQAIRDIAASHGSFAAYVANWPSTDITGLWADIAGRMQHLGGNSTPVFLRMMGKDTFVLTEFVVRSLAHWQAFDGPLRSKAAQAKLQPIFNAWHAETGKPFSHLSMILAMSVD